MGFESSWSRTTKTTDYPVLTGDVGADAVVVGGGMAGLCAAWELARTGRKVLVAEAMRIASATTGHATGTATVLHSPTYSQLASRLGPPAAALYAASQTDALEHLAQIVAGLDTDCGLEHRPAIAFSTDPERTAEVGAEAAAAESAGLHTRLVTATALPFPVAAAVRVEDQAQFHPRALALALAADLVRRGGLIFEGSRVAEIGPGPPARLRTTAGGRVTADDVVIASGFPALGEHPDLTARLTPHRELVVAGPLPGTEDPGGIFLASDDLVRSIRTAPLSPGQRLLLVSGQRHTPGAGGVADRFAALAAWVRRTFPVTDITDRWSTLDYTTSDSVPFIGRLPGSRGNVWVATGLGGWGMTNAVVAGRLLAARVGGVDKPPWADLYDPGRLSSGAELPAVAQAAVRAVRSFFETRVPAVRAVLTPPSEPDPGPGAEEIAAHLRPGQGAVVDLAGEKCAVCRDENGVRYAMSATCTREGGCQVGFNDAEKTWECPCHGCRFAADGSVLQGPATVALPGRFLGDPV